MVRARACLTVRSFRITIQIIVITVLLLLLLLDPRVDETETWTDIDVKHTLAGSDTPFPKTRRPNRILHTCSTDVRFTSHSLIAIFQFFFSFCPPYFRLSIVRIPMTEFILGKKPFRKDVTKYEYPLPVSNSHFFKFFPLPTVLTCRNVNWRERYCTFEM